MTGKAVRRVACLPLLAGLVLAGAAAAQTSRPGSLPAFEGGGRDSPRQTTPRPASPRMNLPGSALRGGEPGAVPAGPVFRTRHVTAELLSEHRTLQPGSTAWLALRFRIAPRWHTYWRNAGDSGEATRIDWTLPAGYAAGDIAWPPPGRIAVGPLVNYGYSDEAIHLVPVAVPQEARPGGTATLAAHASWLVCEQVCIPEEGVLKLSLPVAAGPPPTDGRTSPIFARARAALPKASPWPAQYRFDGDRFRLDIAAPGLKRDAIAEAWFYPYGHGVVEYAAAQKLTVSARGLRLETRRGRAPPAGNADGVLVVRERLADGGMATLAFRLKPAAASAPAAPVPEIGFWEAALLALLGGLILNLMPCVLPILAVKALAFADGAGPGRSRAGHGAAYVLGVLASFAIVGAVLLALRGAGAEAGWGFQLQEPVFVLLMAWLMVVIGLNFAGLFEIGGRLAGLGSHLAGRAGHSGSFFTGALAVVVATPCTAPFMGAAVGFALGQPAAVALAVMLALGLGFALPFLLLSLMPGLQRLVPRPGPWTVRFRQFLAFPMFATAAWLVWVLSLQAGDAAVLAALAGAVLLAFAIWLWQASVSAARLWRPLGLGLAAAAVVAALAMVRVADGAGPAAAPSDTTAAADAARTGSIVWEPFSEARLARHRAEGRPVFINFTAAWCITCIANERVVLRLDSVAAAARAAGMAMLKGDWTRRDPAITKHLAAFGRSGVPLYVIWPPQGSPKPPAILPQILTEGGTIRAIRAMAGTPRPGRAAGVR